MHVTEDFDKGNCVAVVVALDEKGNVGGEIWGGEVATGRGLWRQCYGEMMSVCMRGTKGGK